jgi:tyrosine-protein phosphatase non-receptor type 1
MNMTDDARSAVNASGTTSARVVPFDATSGGTTRPRTEGAHPDVVARLQSEFAELETKAHGWEEMFVKINEDAYNPSLTFKESRKPKNRALNRYKNVSPYDHSRIVLSDGPVDYVNANLVEVPSVGRRYILSQGPLEYTASHFWLMIWQQKSEGIVMLNALFEKKMQKCFQYWPAKIGESLNFPDVDLAVSVDC